MMLHKRKVDRAREEVRRELAKLRARIEAETDNKKRGKLEKVYARMVYSALDGLGDIPK